MANIKHVSARGGRWRAAVCWTGRTLGLIGLLSAGLAGGWQAAWWQHAAFLPGPHVVAELARLEPAGPAPSTLAIAVGPALVADRRMPEDDPPVASSPNELEADEAVSVVDADEIEAAEPPLFWVALLQLLDPRDAEIYPPPMVADAPPGSSRPPTQPGRPSTYVVEPGDTLGGLASRFGVNPDTLGGANGVGPNGQLQAGQPLRVPGQNEPVHTVVAGETLSEIALRYGADVPTIAAANELDGELVLLPGQRLIIPGGVLPIATAVAAGPTLAPSAAPAVAPTRPAPVATRTPTAAAAAARPPAAPTVAARAATPQPTPRPTSPPPTAAPAARPAPQSFPGGPLVWPANGTISQRFGTGGHSGIDIAAATGAPIRAAAGGKVIVAAKLNYGYGWRIIVDHGGGYTTLYAHFSSFAVEVGARVGKGQLLGAVGATGLATGPHLHFEVLQDGRPVDPMRFLP